VQALADENNRKSAPEPDSTPALILTIGLLPSRVTQWFAC
jgi:hypothetical protein